MKRTKIITSYGNWGNRTLNYTFDWHLSSNGGSWTSLNIPYSSLDVYRFMDGCMLRSAVTAVDSTIPSNSATGVSNAILITAPIPVLTSSPSFVYLSPLHIGVNEGGWLYEPTTFNYKWLSGTSPSSLSDIPYTRAPDADLFELSAAEGVFQGFLSLMLSASNVYGVNSIQISPVYLNASSVPNTPVVFLPPVLSTEVYFSYMSPNVLSLNNVGWTNYPNTFNYNWLSSTNQTGPFTSIGSSNSPLLELNSSYNNTWVSVELSATNTYATGTVTSSAIQINLPNLTNLVPPFITDSFDEILSYDGIWYGVSPINITRTWELCSNGGTFTTQPTLTSTILKKEY